MKNYIIGKNQNNDLIFKNLENGLIYHESEIKAKIKDLNFKRIIAVSFGYKEYDLSLSGLDFSSHDIMEIIIKSNNQNVMTIDNTNRLLFNNWLKELSNIAKNEQEEISEDVKNFFKENENILDYNYEQINTILNHSNFKQPIQSKERILKIIGDKFENKANTIFNNICNSKQIDKNILNNYSEEIKKLVFKKIKALYQNIITTDLAALSIPLLIRLCFIFIFDYELMLLGLGCSLLLVIVGLFVFNGCAYDVAPSLIKFIKYKKILHMLNPKNEKTLSHTNSLNNNTLETKKEDIPVRKEIYLESLKECIKLMTENPNIDWTTEKKKIMILAESYTKYKKTSQLDNITLLQTCPTFMSELCDLEIAIKNKINANKKEDVYEENLAEITTLLDNIKTPEMALKLERKL